MADYFTSLTRRVLLVVSVLALIAVPAAAQTPTGSITGQVADQFGGVVVRATVTVSSPALQGTRTVLTSGNGDYTFPLLPPGTYTVSVEANGFATSRQDITVSATQPASLDVVLRPAAVEEVVTVSADGAPFEGTPQAAVNYKSSLLTDLPTTRTVLAGVDLAPAVHETGPAGERSINGGMSYENQFLINGVQAQDNLRGSPLNLFIEDAVQEITTTTSGISAEYGRFTGGVVNVITKSGGNIVSGSLRTTFNNDSWRSTSPFGEPKQDTIVPTYELTAGGPIWQDRTWFFAAGRFAERSLARETAATRIPYTFVDNEKRFEGKVTHAFTPGQRLQAGYTGILQEQTNNAFPSPSEVMDLNALTTRELPQGLVSVHYTGIVSPNFAVEGQYSARSFRYKRDGGTNTDLIQGTPLIDFQTGAWWWAPSFCGVCADETRDNDSLLLKGSYFLSTGTGTHNLTFGYDTYNDKSGGDLHQSATDYHVYSSASFVEDGVIYPVFEPGFSAFVVNWPITQANQGTRFRTHSLFVSDSWAAGRHFTVDLGLRWDKNQGRDSGRNLVADDSMISPRVGVVWDPTGTGRTTFNASAGRYVAALANNIANMASPAGLSSILVYAYFGDPINADPSQPRLTSDQALSQVFNWYQASGGETLIQATIPGLGLTIPTSLESPYSDEYAVGMSQQIGARGLVRVDVVDREFSNFYSERIDTTTGQATDEYGQMVDVSVIENTNGVTRRYTALNAQGTYRLGSTVHLGASYTLSRLHGNMNGEAAGSGPLTATAFRYPEYRDLSWALPEGDLLADQRHRARIWGVVELPTGDANRVSIGAVQMIQSGTPYGAVGTITMFDAMGTPYVDNPGYVLEPFTETYFFTDRDAFRTETMVRTDLSVNYSRRFGRARSTEVFANLHVLNVFNQFQLFNATGGEINRTVLTANNDPARFAPFNPFTETPVQGVHWDFGDEFGKPNGANAYTLPRTLRLSVGVRF